MLHDLKEKLTRELEEYSQNGKFSKEDVETIKYMASAVDHLCNIEDRDEMSSMYGSYNDRMGNRSYARKRNSMGRYSSTYSRTEPREIVDELRGMMQDFPQGIQADVNRLIQKLEMM